jgi:aryl-alcohol dehydrogenase-like predicted oxidoreductase
LEYTTLSNTDLRVSRVGFGAEPLGGTDWGSVNVSEAVAAVARARDLGITLYDTADVYGLGRSEELLSKGLGAYRHEVVIVTKFGVSWRASDSGGRAKTFFDASRTRVIEALEGSLRRLRVDCIPLYLIHWPDNKTPIGETLEALQQCREAGKIRYVGVSNFPPPLIREAHRYQSLAAVECQHNLIDRSAELDILPCCRELNISVLSYGPLAQGLLTGRHSKQATFPENDRRHRLPHFQTAALEKNILAVSRMKSISDRYGRSLPQMAIRWALDTPGISCTIVGAKRPSQVEDNAGAAGWQLTADDWNELANASSVGPHH